MKAPNEITNDHGLLMYEDDKGKARPLGYLWQYPEHGIFDANFGKVSVSPEDVETHNKTLAEAEILGLDNCEVGQHGIFYIVKKEGRTLIQTWTGTLVSDDTYINGRSLTFHRAGKTYRGTISRQHDMFKFRRIK